MSDTPAMSETRALPPPEEPEPAPRAARSVIPILSLIGFLILAAAIFYVWRNPNLPPAPPSVDPATVADLQQQVQSLTQRVAQLQQRPAAQPVDLRPIESRISALEQQVQQAGTASAQPAAPPDLGPIEARVAAVEQKTGGLEQRTAGLSRRPPTWRPRRIWRPWISGYPVMR